MPVLSELVQRLIEGEHEVTIGNRNESGREIKQRIREGYVHVKFTQTKGGTDLGISLDLNNTHIEEIDFARGQGVLHIEGTTNLNYTPVKCIADIDLASRKGLGYLQILSIT